MDLTGLGSLFDFGSKILDRVIPDPIARDKAKLELQAMQQSGELAQLNVIADIDKAQIKVNEVEAANPNLFVSGWRPFIGWTCGIALFLYYVPLFVMGISVWVWSCIKTGAIVPRPDLGVVEVLGLVTSLLGMGAIRMMEKIKGVASK